MQCALVRLAALSVVRSLVRSVAGARVCSLVFGHRQSAVGHQRSFLARSTAPHLEVFDRKVGHDNGGVR